MDKRTTTEISLESSIEDLPLSEGLKKLLLERGYKKLCDVLAKQIPLMRKHEGLSFEQEMELFKVVEKNGLEQYWKE
jgi:hypothetical protein